MPKTKDGSLPVCLPRFGTARDPERQTLGGQVGEVCRRLGAPPMPWQQHVLDVAFEVDENLDLVYDELDLLVGRQSGKTRLLLGAMAARCTVFAALYRQQQGVVYTAQTRVKARTRLEREFVPAFQDSRSFREVKRPKTLTEFLPRWGAGSEQIKFGSRSYLAIDAPAKSGGGQATQSTAGHGDTLDMGVIDEALAHPDDTQEQAMRPTMATRRSSQLWVTGTAGFSTSFYWYRKVLAGRAAVTQNRPGNVAYFEYSSQEDEDPKDPVVWRRAIPALGYTISEKFIAAELERYLRNELVDGDELGGGLDGFRRAYLSHWVDPPVLGAGGDRPVPLVDWWTCMDDDSRIDYRAGPVVFAVDVSMDRHTSIVAVGTRADGVPHVELLDSRPGTEWAPARLAQLVKDHRPVDRTVSLDPAGPAGSLIPGLNRAGLSEVGEVNARQMTQACGLLYDTVTGHQLRHIGVQQMANALDAARKAVVGDAWKFSRTASTGDVSPVVALAVGLWVYRQHRPVFSVATSRAPVAEVGHDVFARSGRLKL